ncbi:hypothetical protein [Streptomyces anulatus]|uniref:hypothetical protein n=1 Tax=Streptomyces anulatus TaxID=1892 RepID=UPI003440CA1E
MIGQIRRISLKGGGENAHEDAEASALDIQRTLSPRTSRSTAQRVRTRLEDLFCASLKDGLKQVFRHAGKA